MTEEEFHIKFPKTFVQFNSSNLVFLINHVKSRLTSVLYFKLHCYDKLDNLIYTYVSPRWVIDTEYTKRRRFFTLSDDVLENTAYTQIELISIGTSSENPLFFTECMFAESSNLDVEYHVPNDVVKTATVGLHQSMYALLYNQSGSYLQVIRPYGDGFLTNCLTKSSCTVLAPHFEDESDIDTPVNIFMEFINQKEQRIDVLR